MSKASPLKHKEGRHMMLAEEAHNEEHQKEVTPIPPAGSEDTKTNIVDPADLVPSLPPILNEKEQPTTKDKRAEELKNAALERATIRAIEKKKVLDATKREKEKKQKSDKHIEPKKKKTHTEQQKQHKHTNTHKKL